MLSKVARGVCADVWGRIRLTRKFAPEVAKMSLSADIRVLIDHQDPILAAGVAATLQMSSRFDVLRRVGTSMPPHWTQTFHPSTVLVADYETGLRYAEHVSLHGRVLVLTHFDSEAHIRCAIEQGVRGYLLLGCTADELLQGVLALDRGGTAFAPVVAARMAESLTHEALTHRELTVLRHIMLGFSNKEIGRQLAISVGTVKTHAKGIFAKLGASARTEAVAIARRRGLLLEQRTTTDA
jgi:DNA-binding NarL/FixJ family response regulator